MSKKFHQTFIFLSTHSVRSATLGDSDGRYYVEFLSTHSVRSATSTALELVSGVRISIHALRKECDSALPFRGVYLI